MCACLIPSTIFYSLRSLLLYSSHLLKLLPIHIRVQPTLGDYRAVNKPKESSKSGQREHSKITVRTSTERNTVVRGEALKTHPFKASAHY